ncbi:hypothetical protein VTO42DRAFT_6298 [Malbranchea cinnamomea]
MARHSNVLALTSASLPDEFRISSKTSTLIKTLGKLTRSSLIDLVFEWLDEKNIDACRPYLFSKGDGGTSYGDDDMSYYAPAESIEELKSIYNGFRSRKGGKREIIDRILDGDWRHGISLRQLALADFRYIDDNPVGHRWTALLLLPVASSHSGLGEAAKPRKEKELSAHIPRFHAATFVKHIQRDISPLVKAHYHIHRSQTLPLTFVRIFVIDSPYRHPRQSSHVYTDSSRIIYLAFPDSAPFVYSSLLSMPGKAGNKVTTTTDTRTLRRIVMEAIPNALSRPQERYVLRSTSLIAKSLHTLLSLRGPGRSNCANGAFSIFADAVADGDPLDPRPPQTVPSKTHGYTIFSDKTFDESKFGHPTAGTPEENHHLPRDRKLRTGKRACEGSALGMSDTESEAALKKRKLAVLSRFGTTGQDLIPSLSSTPENEPLQFTSSALDFLQIHLKDPPFALEMPSDLNEESPNQPDADPTTLSLTFSGTDVFSGLRKLAELGVVDATRMPSWMTGEEGVSSAVVRGGKMV